MWHRKCGVLGWICLILIIIGGINWGLVGIFGFNLVAFLFGSWPIIERIIYILVGIAAIIAIFMACRCCKKGTGEYTCKGCGCSSCRCGSGGTGTTGTGFHSGHTGTTTRTTHHTSGGNDRIPPGEGSGPV